MIAWYTDARNASSLVGSKHDRSRHLFWLGSACMGIALVVLGGVVLNECISLVHVVGWYFPECPDRLSMQGPPSKRHAYSLLMPLTHLARQCSGVCASHKVGQLRYTCNWKDHNIVYSYESPFVCLQASGSWKANDVLIAMESEIQDFNRSFRDSVGTRSTWIDDRKFIRTLLATARKDR